MSCVAIYSRKFGFSYAPKYSMLRLNASMHGTTFQQKKPFPKVLVLLEIGS